MNKVVAWRYGYPDGSSSQWVDGSGPDILPMRNLTIEFAYYIPDTRCVVPREVTSAIVVDICARFGIGPTRVGEIYRAMLNAAEVGDE